MGGTAQPPPGERPTPDTGHRTPDTGCRATGGRRTEPSEENMSRYMGAETAIEVSGLRKRFGSTMALDGMSFTVRPGRVTGFVGPNGAGKSTTMRVILGLDAPDEGTALIEGRPYRTLSRPM